jgi:hypothetical protein
MSRHSQDRFSRLAIVGSNDKKARRQPDAPRWWGPQRARFVSPNDQIQTCHTFHAAAHPSRMAVMPRLPRGFAVFRRMWNFLCSYFVTDAEQQRGAVVLSFRRYAGQPGSFRRAIAGEGLLSKKSNGSVGWNIDTVVAPREGGRG